MHAENDIDEEVLQEIASLTGARYFRATSEGMLAEIYTRIGDMEKTKIEVKHFTTYEELAPRVMLLGLALLLLELLASATVLRGMP
jgi:Ca-activated chloride channel family protein